MQTPRLSIRQLIPHVTSVNRFTLPRLFKFAPAAVPPPPPEPTVLPLAEDQDPVEWLIDCGRCGYQPPREKKNQVRCSRCGQFIMRADELAALETARTAGEPQALNMEYLARRADARRRLARV